MGQLGDCSSRRRSFCHESVSGKGFLPRTARLERAKPFTQPTRVGATYRSWELALPLFSGRVRELSCTSVAVSLTRLHVLQRCKSERDSEEDQLRPVPDDLLEMPGPMSLFAICWADRDSNLFSDRSASGWGIGNPADILSHGAQPVIARCGRAKLQ